MGAGSVKKAVYGGISGISHGSAVAAHGGAVYIPGESCLVETIFEDRFKSASQLLRMGAYVRVDGRKAVIRGGTLRGAAVEAQELRGGAPLSLQGWRRRGRPV